MKKITTVLVILLSIGLFVYAQKSGAFFEFKNKNNTHNFGVMKQGQPQSFEFEFKNIGNKPLVIQKVDVSCGCTSPEWPKTPVTPGKTGKIKVTYDAATAGAFNKSIYIKSNATNVPSGERVELIIKGEVK